ncbi:hypothetical protein [Tessaracoccus coleopterorum]|uniref:hypothetical protein n=1 Tax=Tessaracoccus coleopterorum TaxID=2714950 RepID=UPI0018D4A5B5|nr:hypothetical protein [Tessaracoccus coleopterorum]
MLAVGDPELPFPEALAAAADWYGRPATLQAVLGGRTADAALAAGMAVTRETLVLVRAAPEGRMRRTRS